jgi:hypothetical protein
MGWRSRGEINSVTRTRTGAVATRAVGGKGERMARAAKRKSKLTDDSTLREAEARNSELEDALENALG